MMTSCFSLDSDSTSDDATEYVLTTPLQRARGVIGRYPAADERYVLSYSSVDHRGVHMLGVRKPLRVTWEAHGEVVESRVLRPWTGHGAAECDRIIEERPETYRE